MKTNYLATFAVAALVSSPALADVTAIGEFTGDGTETFENIASPGGVPGPVDIFGGAATINDSLANQLVLATVVSSSDTGHENFFPHNGFLMGLVPTGWTTIEFDTPVSQFGGFFGSAAFHNGGGVTFFDEDGNAIGSDDMEITAMQWDWHGWESDTPISSIQIRASADPSAPMVMDNLQYTAVPAPGALALLAVGTFAAGRRRRH